MSPASRAVGAILVTRGDAPLTQSVLRAIENQSMAPRSLTIIDVAGRRVTPFPADRVPRGAELVRVGRARNLGDAIRRAYAQGAPFASEPWWWILHDDSAPEPECLSELVQAGTVGKTVGAVGVKQLSWDGSRLLELGIFATASARRLERIGDDEIDQGQYDGTTDVLGVGTAGMFLRAEAYDTIGGFDPALGPFGDGLDMGRRLHLAGYRVIVAPRARVRHARTSMTPGIDPTQASALWEDADSPEAVARLASAQAKSFRRRRSAQMYNWCKAVPALALPFLALWLLLWTPARALGRFVTGRATLALPEIAALLSLVAATPRLLAGRARAAQSRTVPRSSLRALEIAPAALRKEPAGEEEDDNGERIDPLVVASMRSYRIRSASTGLALLIATSMIAGLQWWGAASGLVGGAWVSLPASWWDLWSAAWAGWIPGGDGYAGGADPLTILMALLSAPVAPLGVTPGAVATFLLVASSPLAAMAAWVPTRCLTTSLRVRFLVSLAWALSPALLMSAAHGGLAGTLAHVALPILAAYCVSAAAPLMVASASGVEAAPTNPRGVNAGCAGLAVLVLACCAPWTAPERRGAHMELAPTEHRRPARGCGCRSYLLEHSCSPVSVGGPDLDDRWGPRVHSRVLVVRFPWNAGCPSEHTRSDRFWRPWWRCRAPCSRGHRASSHDRPCDGAERRACCRAVWVGSLARRGRTRWRPRRLSLDVPRLLGVLRTAPDRR